MGNCCQKHCACLEPYIPWLFQDDDSGQGGKPGQTICNPAVVQSGLPEGPCSTASPSDPDLKRRRKLPPPPVQNGKFVALFDYHARTEDDLSFRAGDKLEVVDASQEGWWFAKLLVDNGLIRPGQTRQGYIPANYVAPDQSIEAEP